jgi:ABC-2 type transport system permease protein
VTRLGLIRIVAEREVRERTKSRAFRISTLISLAGVIAVIAIPARQTSKTPDTAVGIVGAASPQLRAAVRSAVVSTGAHPILRTVDEQRAKQQLAGGRLDLAVVDSRTLLVDKVPAPDADSRISRTIAAVSEAVRIQGGLERAGLPADQAAAVINGPPPEVQGLRPSERPKAGTDRAAATLGILLLFFMLSQYGYWILGGVVEEKSSRVIEILVASVRAGDLLAGKVIGIGVLAVGHAALLAIVAVITSAAAGGGGLPKGSGEAIALAVIWFGLGYAFYCTLYAGMGSLISRSEEIQNVSFPIQIPLLLGYFVGFASVSGGTSSPLLQVLAYVPFTAPMCMPALRAIGEAALWQVGLSMLISIAGTVVAARGAALIYRRAILRTGRRQRVRELLRSG